MINRSHKYKNKYVHRRTSVTLENLTEEEVSFFVGSMSDADVCVHLM